MRTAVFACVAAMGFASPVALAAGTFAWPAAGLVGDDTDSGRAIAAVRALIVADGDAHVIVLQASAESVGDGAAWLVPLPGTPSRPPVAVEPADLEPLLRATDPLYPLVAGCGDSCANGCTNSQGFDSGALVDVRTFGAQTAAGNRAWFGPAFISDLIQELRWNGIEVDASLQSALTDAAAQGWGVLVVQLEDGADAATATPMVAVRVEGGVPVIPMLLTRRTAAETVHALVVTAGPTPTTPTGATTTTPMLGEALYDLEWTPAFYEARMQVAIQEAGGDAWVLEYSGPGTMVAERLPATAADGAVLLFGDDTATPSTAPFRLFEQLVDRGLLPDTLDPTALHYTRWRTYLPRSALTDQAFEPAPALGNYEVRLTREDYNGRLQLFWPALVALGALGRRRLRR